MVFSKFREMTFSLGLCAVMLSAGAVAQSDGGEKRPKGLSDTAYEELEATGMTKYLGQFSPVQSEKVGNGWVKHTFDSAAGEGPVCITGSDYSVYTRKGNTKKKVLLFMQGGGACWQGLYQCNLFAEDQDPTEADSGIWDFSSKENPFRNFSVVYMPYCDGSIFVGDNEVVDPGFAASLAAGDEPLMVDGVRHHRGLRNVSAGMDVAKAVFPNPRRLVLAGGSAGGAGASTFAPFLARFTYGNSVKRFTVFNDAGPLAVNPDAEDAALARLSDWDFGQYYPESCTECDPLGDATALVDWRLSNDVKIREAFYTTDADEVIVGFSSVNLPGSPPLAPFDPANGVVGLDQEAFRELFLEAHDKVHANHPDRYKRFVVSGDDSHTALQTPEFYSKDANGVLLNEWTQDFIDGKKDWVDIVEDLIPLE